MRRLATVVLSVTVGVAVAAALPPSAFAATVSATPAAWTPQITSTDATVRQLVQCGSTMYAVGSFSTVTQDGTTYTRNNAFSFSATTGALTTWNPDVNGEVNTVALSPDCSTAYLGGKFTTVGTAAVTNLAAVDSHTADVQPGFRHHASGTVDTIVGVRNGAELLVGGNFVGINGSPGTAYYASLDPTTGAVDNYLNTVVSGQYGGESGGTKVYNQQLSPQGDRLLFEGIFTSVDGQTRLQIAELDLGTSTATLDPFTNSDMDTTECKQAFYVRAATFSPDEKTVYTADNGRRGTSPFCDAAVAFTNTADATPLWINMTGQDSLYAVAASSTDVYIGGHERWANHNRHRCIDDCVSRPGIGDIDPTTGLATSWNPTRDRGHGADDMLLTPAGLWVASDTFYDSVLCAQQYHPGICFFPNA